MERHAVPAHLNLQLRFHKCVPLVAKYDIEQKEQ